MCHYHELLVEAAYKKRTAYALHFKTLALTHGLTFKQVDAAAEKFFSKVDLEKGKLNSDMWWYIQKISGGLRSDLEYPPEVCLDKALEHLDHFQKQENIIYNKMPLEDFERARTILQHRTSITATEYLALLSTLFRRPSPQIIPRKRPPISLSVILPAIITFVVTWLLSCQDYPWYWSMSAGIGLGVIVAIIVNWKAK